MYHLGCLWWQKKITPSWHFRSSSTFYHHLNMKLKEKTHFILQTVKLKTSMLEIRHINIPHITQDGSFFALCKPHNCWNILTMFNKIPETRVLLFHSFAKYFSSVEALNPFKSSVILQTFKKISTASMWLNQNMVILYSPSSAPFKECHIFKM